MQEWPEAADLADAPRERVREVMRPVGFSHRVSRIPIGPNNRRCAYAAADVPVARDSTAASKSLLPLSYRNVVPGTLTSGRFASEEASVC